MIMAEGGGPSNLPSRQTGQINSETPGEMQRIKRSCVGLLLGGKLKNQIGTQQVICPRCGGETRAPGARFCTQCEAQSLSARVRNVLSTVQWPVVIGLTLLLLWNMFKSWQE